MHGEPRQKIVCAALATGLLLLLPVKPVLAAVDYFDLEPEQLLHAKVLSVSKREESVAESPAAVYVITSEDIIRMGVTNVPDALRMVPGVNVTQVDGNSWAITIRGFNSVLANKLLVMIDGRTIYNPLFGGVFWEAHDLMMEDIDRIEVIRGPGGTLWGANAVNGVINIITKHSSQTQHAFVSALSGNEELGTMSVRQGGEFGEEGSYRIYTKGFHRASSRKPGGDPAMDSFAGYRGGFRADWGDWLTVQGDVYHNEADQNRFDYLQESPFAVVEDQTIKYEGANLLGRWTDARDDGSQLSIQSYLDWTLRDEPFNFTDNRGLFDVEVQYNFRPIGIHEIITGAGFRYGRDDERPDTDVSFDSETRSDSLYSFFVQDKIALVPEEWFLTVGSKFEHNEYSGYEIQPSARLQWQPDDAQTVWGAVSRAVKTPTRIEHDVTATFGTGPNVIAELIGNEGFDSEEMIAYELGYRNQITSSFSLDTTAYYNDYNRLATLEAFPIDVQLAPLLITLPLGFRNNMEGKTYGFEIAGSWSVTDSLKLTANYSLLRLSLEAPRMDTQEAGEDNFPAHQVNIGASWNVTDAVTFDTTAHYVDRLKRPEVNDYLRLDMNLGWQITNSFRVNVVGQNLLDSAHREYQAVNDINAAEIERSIFGKLTWEF